MQRVIDVTEWTRKFEKIANRKIEQYKQQNSDAPKMAAFFNVTDMRAMERQLKEIKKYIPPVPSNKVDARPFIVRLQCLKN